MGNNNNREQVLLETTTGNINVVDTVDERS